MDACDLAKINEDTDRIKKLHFKNADESKTPTVPSPITVESWISESKKLANG